MGTPRGRYVLANIPRSRALNKTDGRALEPLPPADAESFQMLRANLRFLHTDKDLRSVVVTSPGVGDGKSTASMNLAKADASVGKRVLLIEADMRRPKLGALLGIGEDAGLATYLAGPNVDLVDVTRRVPVANQGNGSSEPMTMDVVVSGRVPGNPSELINPDRMLALVSEGERDYDLVVIDTSPAGLVADAIPLMSRATAVIIVGRVGRITSSEANNLREQLQRIDAIDEVAWRKGHRYLTLVGDHRRRRVVWGCEGKGQAAADAFFAERDPDEPVDPLTPAKDTETTALQAVGATGGPDERTVGERAGKLVAVSMDMGEGYASRSASTPASSHLHRQLSRRSARDQGAGRGSPRALERAAPHRRATRRQGVQGRPLVAAEEPRRSHRAPGRHARRAARRRREGPAR